MRADYYHQLRKHLEPESSSQQSRSKSIVAASPQNTLSVDRNSTTKIKQDLFRNHAQDDSFSSLDTTALI